MIDLSLMAHLVAALPSHARLILMGDKDQLASVEAGNVLGDICHPNWIDCYSNNQNQLIEQLAAGFPSINSPIHNPIQDSIVVLKKSYRFHDQSGIGHVAKAINQGKSEHAAHVLNSDTYPDTLWYQQLGQAQIDQLLSLAVSQYRQYLNAQSACQAIEYFQNFRLLCATRNGPWGVIQLNTLIERALSRAQLIDASQRWYRGRPIMVMENDYSVNLFNGDIAILWPDSEQDNKLRAYFLTTDNELRKVLPNRLPNHETVYAMTIHKSQGSEFSHVAVLLPEKDSQILSRELIYTAITRAKDTMSLFAIPSIFKASIRKRIVRRSGLKDMLWPIKK